MADSRIDQAILSIVGQRPMKVAVVIVKVARSIRGDVRSEDEARIIFQHIDRLVVSGDLAARGEIQNWRFSEIRRRTAALPKTAKLL
jgi:hypothetical protein